MLRPFSWSTCQKAEIKLIKPDQPQRSSSPLKDLTPPPAPLGLSTVPSATVKMCENGVSCLQLEPQLVLQRLLNLYLISVSFVFTLDCNIPWN